MKKLLFLITSLIAAGAMCIAGCSQNKQSGENTDLNDTEIIVEEQTEEHEDKIHRPLPRTPRLHSNSVEGAHDDNIDDIPEMPRPRPKKPHRKFPAPLPEHRPIQPK